MTSDELTPIVEAHDRQIGRIVTSLEGLATTIQAHDRQLGEITVKLDGLTTKRGETSGKLDALIQIADDWIRSQDKH